MALAGAPPAARAPARDPTRRAGASAHCDSPVNTYLTAFIATHTFNTRITVPRLPSPLTRTGTSSRGHFSKHMRPIVGKGAEVLALSVAPRHLHGPKRAEGSER